MTFMARLLGLLGRGERSGVRRRFVGRVAAIGVLGLGATLGIAAPAQAATPRTSVTAVAYSAPTPASAMVGGIPRGVPVTMRCWVDNAWSSSPYRTNRWFFVEAAGWSPSSGRPIWVRGYVSANTVVNQAAVPHC
ncbi:hypothetical protein GCM10025792_24180 [Pseudonocardia tropica]